MLDDSCVLRLLRSYFRTEKPQRAVEMGVAPVSLYWPILPNLPLCPSSISFCELCNDIFLYVS